MKSTLLNRHFPLFLTMMAVLATTIFSGCVQRRLNIRSQPEGAFVTIDHQPIGYTPLVTPFVYSGSRDVKLEKDGFKTIKVTERIRPPLWDTFPISLITNHFSPRELRDERLLEFEMEPREQTNENNLLQRANDLRGNIRAGTVTAPIAK